MSCRLGRLTPQHLHRRATPESAPAREAASGGSSPTRWAAHCSRTDDVQAARAAAPQDRPPRRQAARTCHIAQHGASWASPTAEGACRAGTRPRVCSAASRTHSPRCGVNALPLSASTWPTQPSRSRGHTPQSGARMRPRGHDAPDHTACGPPSATRPPPAGREGQGRAPSQARPDRARHGPVRTRVRVRPRRM